MTINDFLMEPKVCSMCMVVNKYIGIIDERHMILEE